MDRIYFLAIIINKKEIQVPKGTTLKEISKTYQGSYNSPIILGKVNGQYRELSFVLIKECEVEFLTT